VFGERLRARILLEASTESEWVAQCLEGLGHEADLPHFSNGFGVNFLRAWVHGRARYAERGTLRRWSTCSCSGESCGSKT